MAATRVGSASYEVRRHAADQLGWLWVLALLYFGAVRRTLSTDRRRRLLSVCANELRVAPLTEPMIMRHITQLDGRTT